MALTEELIAAKAWWKSGPLNGGGGGAGKAKFGGGEVKAGKFGCGVGTE